MPNDPTVQVAIVGILTTFITTVGVVLVAVLNNRKERVDAADSGVEATLRERIALRDEQLSDAKADLARAEARAVAAETERDELRTKLAQEDPA